MVQLEEQWYSWLFLTKVNILLTLHSLVFTQMNLKLMLIQKKSHTQMAAAAAKSLQSCPTLCDPTDGSPPGSPVPGILQAGNWSGLPFPSPMQESESEVAQSCPTLRDPMDCSLPGSSVHGIFQARVLEWGAIAFSET